MFKFHVALAEIVSLASTDMKMATLLIWQDLDIHFLLSYNALY